MLVIGLPVKGAITMKKKHIMSEETLTHTVPCRQKQAKEFLQGRSPGVMRSYAPMPTPMIKTASLNPMTPSTAWPTGGKTRFIDPRFYAAAALLP